MVISCILTNIECKFVQCGSFVLRQCNLHCAMCFNSSKLVVGIVLKVDDQGDGENFEGF